MIENKQGHELEFVAEHALAPPSWTPNAPSKKSIDTWQCKHCKQYWKTLRSTVPGVDRARETEAGMADLKDYLDVDPCVPPAAQPVTIKINSPIGDRAEIGHSVSKALADYYGTLNHPGDEQDTPPPIGVIETIKRLEEIRSAMRADLIRRAYTITVRPAEDSRCDCGSATGVLHSGSCAVRDPGDQEPTPRPVVKADLTRPERDESALMRKLESERDMLCALIQPEAPALAIPPTRPCYVCDADTGVTIEGMPLCVGCR